MTSAAAPDAAHTLIPAWSFADKMRKIRRDVLKMEQAEFADQLGVTRQAYAAWESGRNEPRSILAVAKKVELLSRVPAAWLLGVGAHSVSPVTSAEYLQPERHLVVVDALVTDPAVITESSVVPNSTPGCATAAVLRRAHPERTNHLAGVA